MMIFIYGEDTYASREELERTLVHHQKNNPQTPVYRIDAEQSEWDEIAAHLANEGLFESKKVVVIKNVVSQKEKARALADFLSTRGLDAGVALIVYEQGGTNGRSALVVFLKKNAENRLFPPPSVHEIAQFITRYAQSRNKRITPEAMRILVQRAGSSRWRAHAETEKAVHLATSVISAEDVVAHSANASEEDIWQFVDSLASGNKKRALALLEEHLRSSEEPLYLLSMMIRQIRLLLAMHDAKESDAELSRSLGIHPYVVKKTRQQSAQCSHASLQTIYRALMRLDKALKRGRGEAPVLLTILVDSMVKGAP